MHSLMGSSVNCRPNRSFNRSFNGRAPGPCGRICISSAARAGHPAVSARLTLRCRGRYAPATTGRRISIRMVAWRFAPHNHADQADSRRKSLWLSRLARLIRRPVRHHKTRSAPWRFPTIRLSCCRCSASPATGPSGDFEMPWKLSQLNFS